MLTGCPVGSFPQTADQLFQTIDPCGSFYRASGEIHVGKERNHLSSRSASSNRLMLASKLKCSKILTSILESART